MWLALALYATRRIHAISNQMYCLSVAVFIFLTAPEVLHVVVVVSSRYSYIGAPSYQCVPEVALSYRFGKFLNPHYDYSITWTYNGCRLAGSTLILGATWIRIFQQWRGLRSLRQAGRISSLLLRDGTLDFMICLSLRVPILIGSHDSESRALIVAQSMAPLSSVLPAVIACRFALNLRQCAHQRYESAAWHEDASAWGDTVQFRALSEGQEQEAGEEGGREEADVELAALPRNTRGGDVSPA
ncbi:hypothetical protein PsYK624_005740 [Phanerochaete sordida]|uniref:Uncharacterized protein n=1 Tax=Phanerochaete sordida TaxID=48140 RepID=A0A9P3FWQ8_9APHY|nr:hypothetical protein PsYK624_005740 [Phanerochaete sordida]